MATKKKVVKKQSTSKIVKSACRIANRKKAERTVKFKRGTGPRDEVK